MAQNGVLTTAQRRELILDLWVSIRVRAVWRKAEPPEAGVVILRRPEGYDLNGDQRDFFKERAGRAEKPRRRRDKKRKG